MNNNPIEELRNLKVPVSEQEWESIVHDKRYLKKFGRKAGLSPKGRAALIAGAAAVLLTVPILIYTLSHKTTNTTPDNRPVVQTSIQQPESANEPSQLVTPVTASPAATPKSNEDLQALPSASTTTSHTAAHEQSTLVAVTEARIPANNQPTLTSKPSFSIATTPPPTEEIATQKNTPSSTVSSSKKSWREIADNLPQTDNAIPDEDQPTVEKAQEDPVVEPINFFIPSAFTPNGDGLNDIFLVNADFVPQSFEMNIYNRRSTLVFHSNNIGAGWDGKLNGHTLPNGVYIYVIRFTNPDGQMQQKTGQVMLLQ